MKNELIIQLHKNFEEYAQQIDGEEFWFARDLQGLLGYSKWENFAKVIDKAKTACQTAGHAVADHFPDVRKMVDIGSGAERPIEDIALTRYACYLIAQNGNPRKTEIAFAQTYFAVQTRRIELIEKRLEEQERLTARQKLSLSEKELSGLIFERVGDNSGFARIRSKGDTALFGGQSTQQMKDRLGVPDSRALADFLPTITIKAKDFATEITNFNIRRDDLRHEETIAKEHIKNNQDVRKVLTDRGIKPEALPPAEDLKKLERRLKSEEKQLINQGAKPTTKRKSS
ncbi:DNA damage-inducible protein D [Trichlorobacter lovleyi]|uniref:DNA damage-inducible protein D n=1 Tax=Trichlorobacter lovleyi TaxID=313985 RepID=UPI0022408DBC|nr:DNA damage-inducible protein D [Trichlorobacter lovleyi]QOX80557.1 DNA damage-inducible protein D [Trichlorobacter lovleyi]